MSDIVAAKASLASHVTTEVSSLFFAGSGFLLLYSIGVALKLLEFQVIDPAKIK